MLGVAALIGYWAYKEWSVMPNYNRCPAGKRKLIAKRRALYRRRLASSGARGDRDLRKCLNRRLRQLSSYEKMRWKAIYKAFYASAKGT